MARVITGTYTHREVELSAADRRRAHTRLARAAAKNPLRRVTLACETAAQRDPDARLGDRVWCDQHADFAVVVSVVE